MSGPSTSPSLFFRLPRELRDNIHALVFETAPVNWLTSHIDEAFPHLISFPDSSTKRHGHNSTTIFHAFPALCCTSRQLSLESTPFFLTRVDAFTLTAQSVRLFYERLDQFPNDEGFKAIREYAAYGWNAFDQESTEVHVDLLTRLINLDSLHLSFNTPTIVSGGKLDDYDWKEEEDLWCATGLLYSPKSYYTHSEEIREPEARAELEKRENAMLEKKLDEFIKAHKLHVVLDLSKISYFSFGFQAEEHGQYRHNLHHPLYKWFEREWKQRGRDVCITSSFKEDFE